MRAPEPEDEQLTHEEIEAILARENAVAPEQPPAEHRLAERDPNQVRFGKWIVWAMIAFLAMGVIQSMR